MSTDLTLLPRIGTICGLCAGPLLLLACEGCRKTPQDEQPATTNSPIVQPPPARYAGSQSCRECHAQAFEEWQTSNHALAERSLDPELDEAAFLGHGEVRHGSVISTPRIRDGRYELVTQGRDGRVQPFAVKRVFGHTPLRQFLVQAPGGRYQVTELAFDPHRSEWFDVFGDEDRKPHEWGHWTNRGMNWNAMCADCHNTNLHKNYDAAADSYRTTRSEMGVGCEACHAPSGAHVDWQREFPINSASGRRDPMLSAYRRQQEHPLLVDACGTCHSRRSELREEFTPGEPYLDSFMPALPDHDETWYADGQVREEDYVYASFLMSRMYAEGVTCLDCHRPHGLSLRSTGNELCLRCHAGKIDPAKHSFHDLGDAGGLCVNCHMPHTTYMQRHARRDHGFTIPDPQLTQEHGIPNACNRCHTDKSTDWAIEAIERWYGERMERPTRARARLVARARKREEGIERELIHFLNGEAQPTWRAIVAGLLGEWVGSAEVNGALLALLEDESPLVRLNAARALGSPGPSASRAMHRLLVDPVRAVRVTAAWSLGPAQDASGPAMTELYEYLEHNADQPAGVASLASVLREDGRASEAVARLRRAIEWQPDVDGLHFALGMSLATLGRSGDVLPAFEQACKLAPKSAVYHYSLGLARAETGDLNGAAQALEKACELDASFARAWYNLGLAYNRLNRPDAAVRALTRAAELEPANIALWYGLVTVLRDAGRIQEARQAALAILQIEPNDPVAQALLASFENEP